MLKKIAAAGLSAALALSPLAALAQASTDQTTAPAAGASAPAAGAENMMAPKKTTHHRAHTAKKSNKAMKTPAESAAPAAGGAAPAANPQ